MVFFSGAECLSPPPSPIVTSIVATRPHGIRIIIIHNIMSRGRHRRSDSIEHTTIIKYFINDDDDVGGTATPTQCNEHRQKAEKAAARSGGNGASTTATTVEDVSATAAAADPLNRAPGTTAAATTHTHTQYGAGAAATIGLSLCRANERHALTRRHGTPPNVIIFIRSSFFVNYF